MRILLATPGHLKTVPMGRYCVEALTGLGHQVTVMDYRSTLPDKVNDGLAALWTRGKDREEKAGVNRRLRKLVDACKPDLFLTLFGFDLSTRSLEHLRRSGVPRVCWWLNDPFQFERSMKRTGSYDLIFSNSLGSTEQYRAGGIARAYFLPPACHPSVHRPVPPRHRYAADVCFAGDWSPNREAALSALAERFAVRILGPWGKKLPPRSPLRSRLLDRFFTPQEMVALFCSAKVVLNLHTWHGKFDHGVNPRLFEAAGCGAYQLVDWKQEIPTLFDCAGEIRCYRETSELVPFIEEALSHEPQRIRIGRAARNRALSEHTYRHRMATLLERVREIC